MTKLSWVATIGCEGGPVMVVDLPGFGAWTGAVRYADLRNADPKRKEALAEKMKRLTYSGELVTKLPPPFGNEDGGNELECASETEARAQLAALRDAVKTTFPKVEISEDELQIHFLDPDSDGELNAELGPQSEYDASWQAHLEDESWIHTFGSKNASALFYDIEGSGIADVGVSADGSEIVLVRSWLSGEDETEKAEEQAVHTLVETPKKHEEPGGEFDIPTGKAVVIWSPVAAFQLDGINSPDDLMKLGDAPEPPELSTEMIGGIGTVIRVKPGRYRATLASTEDDEDDRPWSCRWCRLTWVG